MQKRSLVLGFIGLVLAAQPAFGQADSWQRKWYWGAQGGVYIYQSPASTGRSIAPTVGGHWMITGKRSALLIGFDQIFFGDSTQSAIADPSAVSTGGVRLVNLSSGRRIQATIYAIPMDKQLQIMVGGGFAVHQITNATAQGPFATLQESITANNAVATADTKAFLVMAIGAQYRVNRWAAFASYNYTPSSKDFLFTSDQHAISVGIRYALTSAHEEVTTER